MKIAILSARFSSNEKSLREAAIERGHQVEYVSPENVVISVENGGVHLSHLSDADRIIVRRTVEKTSQISAIAVALQTLTIPCLERPFHYISNSVSKINSVIRRSNSLKMPSTWAVWSLEGIKELENSLTWPVLTKPDQGFGGKGIQLFNNMADLYNFASIYFKVEKNLPLVIQKEIKRKREYRILMLNGVPLGTVLKCVDEESLVANAAAGTSFIDARETEISIQEIEAVEETAIKAAQLHKLIFTGVDIIVGDDSEMYVIESNRNPQFKETQRALKNINIADMVIQCVEEPSQWM